MTHKEAVRRMSTWLQNTGKCPIVVSELATANGETPDVIGFKGIGNSTVIECKVSRADFLADKAKIFRRYSEMGMGDHRYIACPEGVAEAADMPDGWGLLRIEEHYIKQKLGSSLFEANKRAEIALLMSALRRVRISTAVFVQAEFDAEVHAQEAIAALNEHVPLLKPKGA